MHIILTEAQAQRVREETAGRGWTLNPIPLGDGRFILSPSVLDNPHLSDWREFLASLPQEEVDLDGDQE
jgi:hypothetical protein